MFVIKAYKCIAFALGLFAFSLNTLAIDPDTAQAIEIASDSAEFNDTAGTAVYLGNVIVKQGHSELRANRVNAYVQENALEKIEATGSPATFNEALDLDQAPTQGQATQITYNAREATLVFEGTAQLKQAGNSFSGERIVYAITSRTIRAKGDQSGETRVKIQYQPAATDSSQAPPSSPEDETPSAEAPQ